MSHRRQTPRSFIPQILFRILHLRERLQLLEPRERIVQAEDYLILPEHLILQDYHNLTSEDESQESSHLQSSKSTCLPHSSKESWRSMTTQSIVIKVKPIRNFNCFRISDCKKVSRRSSRLLRTGSKGSHQEGAHLTQQCRS